MALTKITSRILDSSGVTILGTIATGVWEGTPIADDHIASAATWNTASTDRLKWDGGATGLNQSTGRTSLGLGTAATTAASDYATAAQGTKADSAQQPPSEGAFANGDKTKLDAIEASADVTDTTNVTSAGALMDSEVTNLTQVKAFDSTDYVKTTTDQTIAGVKTFSSAATLNMAYAGGSTGMLNLVSTGAEAGMIFKNNVNGGGFKIGSSYTSFFIYNQQSSHQPLTILANSNVGIGTSSSTAMLRKLNIKPATDVPQLYLVQNNNDAGGWMMRAGYDGHYHLISYQGSENELLTVKYNNGNVGIGETNPTSLLHMKKDHNAATYQIIDNQSTGNAAWSGANYKSNSGEVYIQAIGGNFSGSDYGDHGLIGQQNLSTLAIYSTTDIRFRTGGTAAADEKMRITSGGDVLINATSKHTGYTNFTTLKVSSNSGDYCPILEFSGNRHANNGNQNAMIQFWNKTSTAVEVGRITSSQSSGVNYGELQFATASNGTLTERMRITSGGVINSYYGIAFPNQAASNSNGTPTSGGEILDAYEEGTWTPMVLAGSTTSVVANSVNQGNYTKNW